MSEQKSNEGEALDLVPRLPADLQQPGAGWGQPAGGFEADEGESLNVRRYVAAVLRYKWLILLITIVGTAGGFLAADRLPPEYAARATLWVEEVTRQQAAQGPIQTENLLQGYGWLSLLESYVVLDSVVLENRLFIKAQSRPEHRLFSDFVLKERFRPGSYRLVVGPRGERFRLETSDGILIQQGAVGDSIGEQLGFAWAPGAGVLRAGRTLPFTVTVPREESTRLMDRFDSRFDPIGGFLNVELRANDADGAAEILNAINERFVATAAEMKRAKLDELTEILREQLSRAEEGLAVAEANLESFRVQTITLPSDRGVPVNAGLEMTRDPVFNNFFERKVQLDELEHDRQAIERALGEADGELSVLGLELVPAVKESSELSRALQDLTNKRAELHALRQRYTDEHPPVQRLIDDIRVLEDSVIPQLANLLIQDLRVREDQLREIIGSASGELAQIPPRAIEEARLERDVASAANLATTLQQRYEEARLASVSSVPDVRILSPAVAPHNPTSNDKPRLILMAFAASLGLGVLGAILRDRFDSRIRFPEQVSEGLGLPILGGLTELSRRSGAKAEEQRRQVHEALRTVRHNLLHAYGSAGPVVLTISSPGPGEGKSFVASNLAIAFADLGQRTLLIDGDIRRGSLHRVLSTDRRPGLTDHLAGRIGAEAVVQTTSVERLSFVGSGSRFRSAPELLGSTMMRDFLLEARKQYDVILVDTAPLGAGVDPFVLGTLTGNLLLVLRTGASDRDLAEAKLDVVQSLPIRLLGAVLNGVPATRDYRYYQYEPGYEAFDEQSEEPKQLQGV